METPLLNEQEQPPSDTVPVAEKPASPPEPTYAEPGAVIVIPRVAVNYVIVAVVFFALGAIISGAATSALFNANSAENVALVNTAVSEALDARGQSQVAAAPALQPGDRYDVSEGDDPSIGDPKAPVTIIEFADFHCPWCSRFEHDTLNPLLTDYAGKVRLVFRDLPILGSDSVEAALAGQCMKDQNKFWEFHNLAFDNQDKLNRDTFVSYAQQLGINVDQFTKCLDQQTHLDAVNKDASDATTLGVTGTPAFFVNGVFISGAQPYAVFASTINGELSGQTESTPDVSSPDTSSSKSGVTGLETTSPETSGGSSS